MKWRSQFFVGLLSFAFVLSACGGEEENKPSCTDNSDCEGRAICMLGECSAPRNDANVSETEEDIDEETAEVEETESETSESECLVDDDCPSDERCFNAKCQPKVQCETNDDCAKGSECVGGECFEKKCRGPSDCSGDKVCSAGECQVPPEPKSCFVATSGGVITHQEEVQLQAFARDENGNGIPGEFNWSSSNPEVVEIDSSGPMAIGGEADGEAEVTASLADSGTECDGAANFNNPGPVKSGQMRVTVVEVGSKAPVSPATVVAGDKTAETNGSGIASISMSTDDPVVVSVFADDYNYFTVKGVKSRDLRIPLSVKDGSGEAAGFTGQFDLSNIHTSGNFTLGLAGASFPGGLINLSVETLLGESFQVTASLGPGGGREIPLPSGIIGYGQVFGQSVELKRKYYAQTSEGGRLAWGLSGKVPAQRLLGVMQNSGGLATLLPIFNRFDHAVQPVNLSAKPLITDSNDLDGDGDTSENRPDYDAFPEISLAPSVRQDLVTEVDITNFPSFGEDSQADTVILVGGAIQESAGFVPLGISGTNDDNGDGQPDARRLSFAPPHGSITESRFAVAALAVSSEGGAGFAGSNTAELSTSIWTGQRLETETSLGTFPDASAGDVDVDGRQVVVETAHAGPLMRFQIVGENRSWRVWNAGQSKGSGTFKGKIKIPETPDDYPSIFTESSQVLVDAISASVNPDELVRAGGVGVLDVGLITSSFSRTQLKGEQTAPAPSSP